MKKITVVLALAIAAIAIPWRLRAVTPEELEQARTYAAIIYLRNANNGSDYLDEVNVGSRKALETKLRNDKDKANLKLFNSKLPSAAGSDSWGKDELVKYACKAVQAPGNYSSTGYASNQVSKRVRAMKLTDKKPKPEEPKPEEPQTAAQPEAQQPDPDTVQTANVPDPFATEAQQPEMVADSAFSAAEDSLMVQEAEIEPQQSSGSSTIYIIILVVLVILVVILVIYAARYFNKQDNKKTPARSSANTESAGSEKTRKAYTAPSTDKADEIAQLERTIDSLRAENTELRRAIEEYKYHLNYLKAEKEKADSSRLRSEARAATATPAPTTINDAFSQRIAAPTQPQPQASTPKPMPAAAARLTNTNGTQRIIYLGRANREGMFIRAERNLNPQHSIFKLITTDNQTGSYTIAEDAEIDERILANPEIQLAVSCIIDDPDTYGKETVATLEPGKAIFENGRWRVLSPAHIKFV